MKSPTACVHGVGAGVAEKARTVGVETGVAEAEGRGVGVGVGVMIWAGSVGTGVSGMAVAWTKGVAVGVGILAAGMAASRVGVPGASETQATINSSSNGPLTDTFMALCI